MPVNKRTPCVGDLNEGELQWELIDLIKIRGEKETFYHLIYLTDIARLSTLL